MNRLATLLLAGATFVAAQTTGNSQIPTIEQTKEFTELAAQLQQKLNLALGAAEVDVENARKAALEFQNQMKGKSEEEVRTIMEAKRVMAQEQLQTAIKQLENASAEVQAQVKIASEQIQARLQEKTAEMKMIQQKIQAKKGEGNGKDTDDEKGNK